MEINPPANKKFYASFTLRLRAILIDNVVTVLALTLSLVFLVQVPNFPSLLRAVFFILPFLIEPVLVSVFGGTIGHLIIGIRIEDVQSNRPLRIGRSVIRWIVKYTVGIFSFALMVFSKKHQALHDWMANSVVIVRDMNRYQDSSPGLLMLEESISREFKVSLSMRTILVISFWSVASSGLMATIWFMTLSFNCLEHEQCNKNERLIMDGTSALFLCLIIVVIILGLVGRLYGVGSKKIN